MLYSRMGAFMNTVLKTKFLILISLLFLISTTEIAADQKYSVKGKITRIDDNIYEFNDGKSSVFIQTKNCSHLASGEEVTMSEGIINARPFGYILFEDSTQCEIKLFASKKEYLTHTKN